MARLMYTVEFEKNRILRGGLSRTTRPGVTHEGVTPRIVA
jgi:hypothetical protein